MSFSKLLNNISHKIGLSMKEIRSKTSHELREYLENKNKKKLSFIKSGGVLRDSIITTSEINNNIDMLLSKWK